MGRRLATTSRLALSPAQDLRSPSSVREADAGWRIQWRANARACAGTDIATLSPMVTRTRWDSFAKASVGALFLAGCGNPIVGDWRSSEPAGRNGEYNRLFVNDDGTGDGTLYFVLVSTGEPFFADFDVDWEENGDRYSFDMRCRGCNTTEIDFLMQCRLRGDDDSMACDGSGFWSSYPFAWQLDE